MQPMSTMKKQQAPTSGTGLIRLSLGLFLVFSLIMASCSSENDVTPNSDPDNMTDNNSGGLAKNFTLKSLDGSSVKLTDFNRKVVVLYFLGNNCPYCKAVGPDLEKELNKNYSGKADYAILGLDVWDGNASTVQSFKDVTGISFPLLLNASGVGRDYDLTYDRLVVIDKDGRIAHKGTRAATNDIATVKSKVNELLDLQ